MHPGDFSFAPADPAAAARLGDPDALVNWLDKKHPKHSKAMVALNAPLNYRVFRFIAEWHDATRCGSWRGASATSCRAAVRELRNAGLVEIRGGGYYLTDEGRKIIAHMDRVSPKEISRRLKTYMDTDSAYHAQQQDHQRCTIDVAVILNHERY